MFICLYTLHIVNEMIVGKVYFDSSFLNSVKFYNIVQRSRTLRLVRCNSAFEDICELKTSSASPLP